ncbi:MAG: DegT/DnrJ/EryC1/StrS family aminotransferase [Firmicutes bacterium]|nr:DegT/DnrJ/EryC1/StrS family aminotransferase [Candidatus Colivicinus equi]
MKILPNNLKRQHDIYKDEFNNKAVEVLNSGWYVLGNEVKSFEEEFAKYIGTNYCVGVASGLDALELAFRIIGIENGDEVIVASNAYIACVMGITKNGGVPIFVEPDEYDNIDANKIEEKITSKTKAILTVHLFGQPCDMDKIMGIAKAHNLKVVEDCAQSHGTKWKDQTCGAIGDIGCFSFYPTKGLGAFGDGGAITTNSLEYAEHAKCLRNYGSKVHYEFEEVGMNSRLDELQAGLLRVKLTHLDELNEERNVIANKYNEEINNELITPLKTRPNSYNTWHQYVIHVKDNKRDKLIEYLKENDIGTIIHYPIPPHLSKAYKHLGYKVGDFPIAERYANEVISIPMYNGITKEEQDYVIEKLNSFKG